MFRKILIALIMMSFLNYVGCSSSEVITKKELDEGTAQIDTNEEIYCTTKDSIRYYFPKWSYQIVDDTLYGEGTVQNARREMPFNGQLAIDEITSFEQTQVDAGATTGLTLTIMAVGVLAVGLVLLAMISDAFNPD